MPKHRSIGSLRTNMFPSIDTRPTDIYGIAQDKGTIIRFYSFRFRWLQ